LHVFLLFTVVRITRRLLMPSLLVVPSFKLLSPRAAVTCQNLLKKRSLHPWKTSSCRPIDRWGNPPITPTDLVQVVKRARTVAFVF
ncbi:hypothetical protein EV401DRAFT_1932415, partial [Pisolithus croceorrhizus]